MNSFHSLCKFFGSQQVVGPKAGLKDDSYETINKSLHLINNVTFSLFSFCKLTKLSVP